MVVVVVRCVVYGVWCMYEVWCMVSGESGER